MYPPRIKRRITPIIAIPIPQPFPTALLSSSMMHSRQAEPNIRRIAKAISNFPVARFTAYGEEVACCAFAGTGGSSGAAFGALAPEEVAEGGHGGGNATDSCFNVRAEHCVGDPDWACWSAGVRVNIGEGFGNSHCKFLPSLNLLT